MRSNDREKETGRTFWARGDSKRKGKDAAW